MYAPPTAPFGPHRLAERVVRPRRQLRAGLTQLLCVGVGVALGLTLPRIGGGPQVDSTRAVEVLGFVGITVVGVASVIFSLLFLVAQWASGNFSPRLTLFRTDPMVWRTFAFVIGLFAYAICATLTIGKHPQTSVAVPIATAVLAVAALTLVRDLQLRAFQSIQLAHVLAVTTDRARKVAEAFFPDAADSGWDTANQPSQKADPVPLPVVRTAVAWPGWTTTIQQLDISALVTSARDADAVVEMTVRVGTVVQHDDVVAQIHGTDLAPGEVLAAIIAGRERTFHQDPEFAIRLLADIGLRALSPAVNDPATAVQVLDALDGLLRRSATARLDARSVTDEHGAVRVILRLPTWLDFVRISLDDLCRAALDSPMVLLRARALLSGLLKIAAPDRRAPVAARLAWIEDELAARHPLLFDEATGHGVVPPSAAERRRTVTPGRD